MKRTHGTFKPRRSLTTAFGLAILTSGPAFAAYSGSTDLYGNEFARSFGPATVLTSAPAPAYRGGSTDIYENQFARSFGSGASPAPPERVIACTGGSTDIYHNEFQKSFATEQVTRLARCP